MAGYTWSFVAGFTCGVIFMLLTLKNELGKLRK